jgi:hypothetical protein
VGEGEAERQSAEEVAEDLRAPSPVPATTRVEEAVALEEHQTYLA